MIGKILYGGVVWMASSQTGRKVAIKGFKLLTKLGDRAVKTMPDSVSSVFSSTEKAFVDLVSDTPKNKE